MARCLGRFALLLLIDLTRPSTQFESVVAGASVALGKKCPIAASSLEDLLKRGGNAPLPSTLQSLYAALNATLELVSLPMLDSGFIDDLISFDSALSSQSPKVGAFRSSGIPTQPALNWVKWLDSEVSRVDKEIEKIDLSDEPPASKVLKRLWLRMLQARADYEAIDFLLPDSESALVRTAERFRRLSRAGFNAWKTRRELTVKGGKRSLMDPALLALEELRVLERLCDWRALPESTDSSTRVFGSTRAHLRILSAVRLGQLMSPRQRVRSDYLEIVAATGSELVTDMRAAQPVAVTTRLLRNLMEISAVRRRPDDVLICWQRMKDIDRAFIPVASSLEDIQRAVDAALTHMPARFWEQIPAMNSDPLLCCARRLIHAYEAELGARAMALRVSDLAENPERQTANYSRSPLLQHVVRSLFSSRDDLLEPCGDGREANCGYSP